MNDINPTVREIRVIHNSLFGKDLPCTTFNDKRKEGGRIKLWGYVIPLGYQQAFEKRLELLFPNLRFLVYTHKSQSEYCRGSSTVIKWFPIEG